MLLVLYNYDIAVHLDSIAYFKVEEIEATREAACQYQLALYLKEPSVERRFRRLILSDQFRYKRDALIALKNIIDGIPEEYVTKIPRDWEPMPYN